MPIENFDQEVLKASQDDRDRRKQWINSFALWEAVERLEKGKGTAADNQLVHETNRQGWLSGDEWIRLNDLYWGRNQDGAESEGEEEARQ